MRRKWLTRIGSYTMMGVLAACASSGGDPPTRTATTTLRGYGEAVEMTTRNVADQRTFYAPTPRVLAAVDETYATLEIPITIRNSATSTLGNGGLQVNRIEGKRMATYVDCGQDRNGRLANTHNMTLSIVTTLDSVEDDGVEVSTLVTAFGKPRATSGNTIPCNSTGELERRIAELVGQILISEL